MTQDKIELLWLPVAHCEFNPIELVWASVKNKIADKNSTFKVQDVHKLCCDVMNSVPDNLWKNCVRHVLGLETRYRGRKKTLADNIAPIRITIGNDSESDSSSRDE